MRPLTYVPPLRVWFATGKLTEDGKRMFASRDWNRGEKAAYIEATSGVAVPKDEDDEHLPAE